jgi:hypothetical protein
MDKILFYYFFLCIPVRLSLVFMGWYFDENNRSLELVLAGFTAVFALGMFMADIGERQTGFLGQRRWWISSPHAYLFLLYTATTIADIPLSYIFLAVDVMGSVLLQFARIYIIGREPIYL